MKIIKKGLICMVFVLAMIEVEPQSLWGHGVDVSNTVMTDTTTTTMDIQFSLSQGHTFSDTTHTNEPVRDCVWIFVKFSTVSPEGPWSHAKISTVTAGSASAASMEPVADKKGVFVFPNVNAADWVSTGVKVRWNCEEDGLSPTPSNVALKVNAIEMVYISTGSFYFATIEGERTRTPNLTTLGFPATGDILIDSIDDVPTGASSNWPNGYRAFYISKYEVSQEQYADFLNTLPGHETNTGEAAARYPGLNGSYRHTISWGSGDYYTASVGDRACNYLNWDDCRVYCSWAGLRPMTEMEFERASRGGGNKRKYPWGDGDPTTETYSCDDGGGSETFNKYYCNFNPGSYSPSGPVPVGHYLSGDISRSISRTGASPYGVADLSGNNWDHLINCAYTTTPDNGDGDTDFGDQSWPAAAVGKGVRGGSWNNTVAGGYLRVSDRIIAGWSFTSRSDTVGFRSARTP